jgi:hypothetical protein
LPLRSLRKQQRARAVHMEGERNHDSAQVHTQFPLGTSTFDPQVTAGERADAEPLRKRRRCMMGLPRCPYVSTLAGTKVCPWCRGPACAGYLLLSRRAAAKPTSVRRQQRNVSWSAEMNHGDIRSWEDLKLSRRPACPGSNPSPGERYLSSFV